MKLYKYLDEKTICLDIKGREKISAIAELADRLQGHPELIDFDGFLAATYAREKDSTTGIGGGVAIPHSRTDSVTGFVAAVGLSKGGVDFGSVDGKPVRLVILMGVPAAKVKDYLKLLAHLSLLLKQKDFVDRLLLAPNEQAVLRTFAEHED